jgi:Domain of unknown function (DUF3291)
MAILISVTRLRVRSPLFMPQFFWYTFKSARQAARASGFLGGRVLTNPHKVFWTLTAWESEAAMNAYRTHAAHRAAMPKLLHWCDEAAVVHWTQETPELPTWNDAYERMTATGRASKVNHPSVAQVANKFPAPVASRMESILKPPK